MCARSEKTGVYVSHTWLHAHWGALHVLYGTLCLTIHGMMDHPDPELKPYIEVEEGQTLVFPARMWVHVFPYSTPAGGLPITITVAF